MSVRKICKPKGCRGTPRCDHPWWFDLMWRGRRWRMRVDDFAMARGATMPVTSKQTAERVWEPKFVGEIVAGRDPRIAPVQEPAAEGWTVADLLDCYYKDHVEAQGLKDPVTIKGQLRAVKAVLGGQAVATLEKVSEIVRFKAEYRPGRSIATVNRALGTLRAAINWGRFQDPPYLVNSPFHKFGVTIKTKEETKRDRRVGPAEEKTLLNAALAMNAWQHRWVGASMHDRIIAALETCCRQGEMLRIQNRHIDWDQHQVAIPGAHAKDKDNRRIPFDPQGRLAPILRRRKELGPAAYVFGDESGEFQESFKTAWETVLMLANGHESKRVTHGKRVDRQKLREIDLHWHDLRHEGACRLLTDGVDIRTIQLMLGHSDIKQTQRYLNITDEELRKSMTGVWERRRQLGIARQASRPEATGERAVGQ